MYKTSTRRLLIVGSGRRTFSAFHNSKNFINSRDFLLKNIEDYDAAYKGFQWPRISSKFNWGLDYFDQMACKNKKTALQIISENEVKSVSFDKLRIISNKVASFMMDCGLKPHDRIMIMLPNIVELWECTLASIKLPLVILPATTLLTPEEIAYRIKEGNIQHIITTLSDINKFSHIDDSITRIVVDDFSHSDLVEIRDDKNRLWIRYSSSDTYSEYYSPSVQSNKDDPLLQYFTSGTTSKPKLVTHTHQSYPVGHLSTMYWLGLEESSKHLNISTAGWGKHAWSSFFAPWNAGCTVVSYGYPRFDCETLLKTLSEHPITSLCAPPTVWRLLRQMPLSIYKVPHLKQITSAGEPLNPEIIHAVQEAWGLTIREGYGQTETTALIGFSRGVKVRPSLMGNPQPGFSLKLIDENDCEIGGTEEGELAIVMSNQNENEKMQTPLGLMKGYSDPVKTALAMRGGFYRTGDIMSYNTTNNHTSKSFQFIGRNDDVFKANGGYRISPFELESDLIQHKAVLESAVVGVSHPIKGLVPKAFIVLNEGHIGDNSLIENILEFIAMKRAGSHKIHIIEFVNELPKTASGKIRRVELREKKKENQ